MLLPAHQDRAPRRLTGGKVPMPVNRNDGILMKQTIFSKSYTALALGLGLVAATAKTDESGALYTMDNAAAENHVLIFQREEGGGTWPMSAASQRVVPGRAPHRDCLVRPPWC